MPLMSNITAANTVSRASVGFHRHRSQRQDQRAIRFAETHRQHFGVVRDAERNTDDGGEDHQQQSPQCCATVFDGAVFEREAEAEHEEGDGNGGFGFQIFHGFSCLRRYSTK